MTITHANGIRTSKTINGVKHTYILDGTKIAVEKWENNTLIPIYDMRGNVRGIVYNGTVYHLEKNFKGDVIEIVSQDTNGSVVQYTYDAWGRVMSVRGSMALTIGSINPFRYRGYYYDEEIHMYYLMSRYYDPIVS